MEGDQEEGKMRLVCKTKKKIKYFFLKNVLRFYVKLIRELNFLTKKVLIYISMRGKGVE